MSIFFLHFLLIFPIGINTLSCKNETIQIKESWSLTPGNYTLPPLCWKKLLIPEDSFAIVDIDIHSVFDGEEKDAWFTFENSLGFATTSDEDIFYFDEFLKIHLPPPFAYFIFYQPNEQKKMYIHEISLTLKPLLSKVLETIDLQKEPLIGLVTDYIPQNGSLRLVSNDQIWLTTTCEDLGMWSFESSWPEGPRVMNSDAEKIWIFQEYGNHTEIIDSLHTTFFRSNFYQSPIVLTASISPLSCRILAMTKSRRDDFQQIQFGYSVSATKYTSEQEYHLNATEKPAALVTYSRNMGDYLFPNWLLPVVIPEGAKLLIYGRFPSAMDNSSQLEYEFTGSIDAPQFIGGILRTFILTSGTVKLTLADTFNFPLPPDGVTINLHIEEKSMIPGTEISTQYVYFAKQSKGLFYTFDAVYPGNTTGDWSENINIYQEPYSPWDSPQVLTAAEPHKHDVFLNGARIDIKLINTQLKVTVKETRGL